MTQSIVSTRGESLTESMMCKAVRSLIESMSGAPGKGHSRRQGGGSAVAGRRQRRGRAAAGRRRDTKRAPRAAP